MSKSSFESKFWGALTVVLIVGVLNAWVLFWALQIINHPLPKCGYSTSYILENDLEDICWVPDVLLVEKHKERLT
jgi:hypothetical protein